VGQRGAHPAQEGLRDLFRSFRGQDACNATHGKHPSVNPHQKLRTTYLLRMDSQKINSGSSPI
jgi:hypothetical protein